MRKIRATAYLLGMGMLIGLGLWGFKLYKADQKSQKVAKLKLLLQASEQIHQLWTKGDDKNKIKTGALSCGMFTKKLEKVDVAEEYWKCNEDFLKCHLKNYPIRTNDKRQITVSFLKRDNQLLPLELKLGSEKLLVNLIPNCHRAYLPQRTYSMGPYKKKVKDWQWNNYNRHLMIDKFLVNRRQVNNWLILKDKKKDYPKLWEKDQSKLPLPAGNLSKSQMHEYCRDHKKQLLQAHIADATGFHPGDLKDKNPIKMIRAQVPWTYRRGSSFLAALRKNRKKDVTEKNCQKIYSLECLEKFPLLLYSPNNYSWMGVADHLGNVMETFRNPLYPRKNTSFSSKIFPMRSNWQALGVRGYWDGREHLQGNFNWWKESPPNRITDDIEVGFRCMESVL